jgi:hypothetical protein
MNEVDAGRDPRGASIDKQRMKVDGEEGRLLKEEEEELFLFHDTIGDPGRLRLSEGASLKPGEREDCSSVNGGKRGFVVPPGVTVKIPRRSTLSRGPVPGAGPRR